MDLKNAQAIYSIFHQFYPMGMPDEHKEAYIQSLLMGIGTNINDFDNDLETGRKNGFSVDKQVKMAINILKGLDDKELTDMDSIDDEADAMVENFILTRKATEN